MASKEFLESRNEHLENENKLLKIAAADFHILLSSLKKTGDLYLKLDKANIEYIDYLKEQDAIKQTKVEKFHADSIESQKRYEDVCKLLLPIVADMIVSRTPELEFASINFVDGYTILAGNEKDASGQSDYDVNISSGQLCAIDNENKIIIGVDNTDDVLIYPLSDLLIISDMGELIGGYLKHKKEVEV